MSPENEMSHLPSPATRGMENIVISAVLYALLFVVQALLIFTRLWTRCSFSADGVFILLAMIPTSLYFVATLLSIDGFHWNRHVSDIPVASLEPGFKVVFAAEVMFVMACMLAKLSVMKLVRRIMASASAFWRGLVVFVIVLVVVQGAVSSFLVLFQCGLPANFWNLSRQKCASHSTTLLASGLINTITDFIVTLLTIPCILSYQLSRNQKAILGCIYGLGVVSMGAGISRIYFIFITAKESDFTWAYYDVWMTASFQLYLGMLCVSLPAAKLFFSTYLPRLFGPLSFVDHDLTSQHRHSIYAGASSSGEEELLDHDKGDIGIGSGVIIATRPGTGGGLNEEDGEYIKITQHTVVEISRVGEV